MGIDDLWREIIIRPLLNLLVVLYTICFNNMGIAIIVFTVIVRLVTLPLTIKQLRQMKAMTDLQPRMREIQERYSRDRQRVSRKPCACTGRRVSTPWGVLDHWSSRCPSSSGSSASLYRRCTPALTTWWPSPKSSTPGFRCSRYTPPRPWPPLSCGWTYPNPTPATWSCLSWSSSPPGCSRR